jgi:hypothetical protein
MDEDEILRLTNYLAEHPLAGDLMPGTGGARKLRFAKPHQGKRGSYRVITFFGGHDIPIFLMDVYAKGEKINLSAREREELRKELEAFAEEYREGERRKIVELRKRAEVAS